MAAAQLDCESALYHVPDLPRAKRIQQQAVEQMAENDKALRKDYYRILGLERGRVSDAEITRAFQQSILKYSPDVVPESERTRQMIRDIRAVLLVLCELLTIRLMKL